MKKEFAKVQTLAQEIGHLQAAYALLEWDQETYMPKGGIGARAAQRQAISTLVHKRRTSGPFVRALAKLINLESGEVLHADLSEREKAALRLWQHDYNRERKLPASFIKSFSHTTSLGVQAWTAAKEKKSFALFAPHLKKIVKLVRKKASLLGYTEHPYDALLDLYEPGLKTSALDALFGRLKTALTALIREIHALPRIDRGCLKRSFKGEGQIKLCHYFLEAMGLPPDKSRLDLSYHPFCAALHPTDVRMTVRTLEHYLPSSFLAAMHEGGHALYQLGLPVEAFGSPLGEPVSMAMDESQSRLWETLVGLSRPFWTYAYPLVQKEFPESFATISVEEFYRALNATEPSLIRIEADELTYSLHIILRFEIEKALLEGTLEVGDIPKEWNRRMGECLGIEPKNDAEGCLQDIHWSMGAFGYFPSYTLGNLYAGQLFAAFQREHPDWQEAFAKGHLAPLLDWLRRSVHHHGRFFTPSELITRVTGQPLSEAPYLDYLGKKYRALYSSNL